MKIIIALTALLLIGLVPAGASAQSRDEIIEDCADDGRLQGNYSKSEIRDARKNMPSDVAEYTDCADVLRRAELPDRKSRSGSGTIGGAGGATSAGVAAASGESVSEPELFKPADDVEREEIDKAGRSGDDVVAADGGDPARTVGIKPEAKRNGIPGPLVAVLILLGVGAIAGLYPAVRRGGLGRLFGRS